MKVLSLTPPPLILHFTVGAVRGAIQFREGHELNGDEGVLALADVLEGVLEPRAVAISVREIESIDKLLRKDLRFIQRLLISFDVIYKHTYTVFIATKTPCCLQLRDTYGVFFR